jgi:pyruvate kinase
VTLPTNKTKLVCTIGPASESPQVILQVLQAGMNVARLAYSHGDFGRHQAVIGGARSAAALASQRVAVMADLSGPKLRIGQLSREPVELKRSDPFTVGTWLLGANRQLGSGRTRRPGLALATRWPYSSRRSVS